MAGRSPQDLDGFLPLLSTSDIRMKVTVGGKLFTYLEEPSNSVECSDIGMFIDGIVQWLSNSNPKVTQYGIEIITQLITRMRTDFRPYISTVLPLAVDRLGDSKESIKIKALFLIMKLMECDTISPQTLFDKISANAFNHKNSNVKEGAMKLLISTVEEFGANCITISKIVPMIVKLLSDPNVQVRHKAFELLVDLYKHVGEKLRVDIQKKYTIPQGKMTDLMNKFDEAKAAGDLLPTAFVGLSLADDDRACMTAPRRNPSSVKRPGSFFPPSSTTPLQRTGSVRKPNSAFSTLSHIGAVDEDTFIRSFEDVPTIQIFSVRDLDDTMKKLHESIQDGNEQWNKRVDSLKKIRSLVLTGATKYKEFFNNLRYLEYSFQTSVKDLRSQVVRETCITIAFLSQCLGIEFNHFAESIFNNLINLIPNAAKVTASSGLIAIRFILEHTHAPRIVPILANSLGSKSKDIRRACCEFFDQILRTWPTQALKRHITILQDSIKKGIADADSDARVLSRRAYWGFRKHFPEQGYILLNKLEPAYRKVLLTNTGSNSCLLKSVMAESARLPSRRPIFPQSNISTRSSSAIDSQAALRAKARVQYAALARQKVNYMVSSQSVTKKFNEDMHQSERTGRSRGRVSMSQPTSRSGSPSSRFTLHLECQYTRTGERNVASYDSGISQMSVRTEADNHNFNGYKNGHTTTDGVIKILDDLDKDILQLEYKQSNLNRLKELIRDSSSDVLIKNFKKIIKVVFKLLMDNEPVVREQAIILITNLVQKPEMTSCFHNFTELIILKVLNMCCDPCNIVIKVAEECSFALSVSLQPETVVKLITCLISAKEFPINLMAIKMMTKLIDMYGSPPVAARMKEIMLGLMQGYDNPVCAVRKSAVLCMVSLHKVLGEQEFAHHTSSLNEDKLKLLNLYIERAQQSSPTSLKSSS